MNKIKQVVDGIRTFVDEVQVELKKCNWPTRPELLDSTVVVMVSVVIMSLFIGFSDLILMGLMRMVIR